VSSNGRTAVVLFTRDLRVHDQAALGEAARTATQVVPLFVLDPALQRPAKAPNRVAFLLGALADLRRSLRGLGAELVVRRGDPVEQTLRIAHAVGATHVFVGSDASAYAKRREERLARECRRARIELRVENTTAAVPPGELAPVDRDHYRVFTPYWKRWRAEPLATFEHPRRLALPAGIEPGRVPGVPERSPRGGEHEGRRRLDRWLADGLHEYEHRRIDLAGEGTSRLGPYLHFGCLSPTEIVTKAREEGAVAETFVRQLCWRDFYLQLLAANPDTPREDLHPRDRDWSADDEALERWRAGQTGYPIVDAAMRQLRAEGWLHNRARLIVSSFLTKTLSIDWRLGAAVFSELLVDGDVANNVGNWQWVAGTGVDTRPNRTFNAIRQARRFDPNGDYVRRYLPELAELEGAAVHEPWRSSLARVAPEYPERLEARHAARA
jgi:deoxyribodipyrimidine photo-lyase